MKLLAFFTLSVLLISTTTAPALKAQTIVQNSITSSGNTTNRSQLTPFNLVHLAYRGYFQDQGIPRYVAFLSAYESGRITAKDLVQSAINKNKLSRQALDDQRFLRAVEDHLFELSTDG